jgi:hypothetical protein
MVVVSQSLRSSLACGDASRNLGGDNHVELVLVAESAVAPVLRAERARDRDGVPGGGFVCSEAPAATWRSACESAGGRSFPRFAARRRIPAHARALKKYRCGTSPVSKTSDNEHTLAALCQAGKLSVKYSVGEPIPEEPQPSEEGSKRPSSVD